MNNAMAAISAPRNSDSKGTVPYSVAALQQDLLRLRGAWKKLQSSRNRDAVYGYLTEVFELVAWWMEERRANEFAGTALYLSGIEELIEVDPFAAVILCTSHRNKVDLKTRSKWSRALRYAAAVKDGAESLEAFIKRQGGINAAAARFSQRRRRESSPH
jgi:hypothetical protein